MLAFFLLGASIGLSIGALAAFLIWRKLRTARRAYDIAAKVSLAMEKRSNQYEEALRDIIPKYVQCYQEQERLRSEKLKSWGIPDRM